MRIQWGTGSQESSPAETLEETLKREVDQARLNWQTRKSRYLEYRLKWRRFYRENPRPTEMMELLKGDAEKRIVNMEGIVNNPRFVTGETWTRAAELLEETEAQLDTLKEVLSRGLEWNV